MKTALLIIIIYPLLLFASSPVVHIIRPKDGDIVSCPRQQVWISIHTNQPLNRSSLFLTAFIGTEVFELPDSLVSIFDTLYIFPAPRTLSDGETVNLLLAPVSDIFGNESEALTWSYLVDTSPPRIASILPTPGSTSSLTNQPVSFEVNDILSGVSLGSSRIIVNSDTFSFDSGVFGNEGTNFTFYPYRAGLNFLGGDTVNVCIEARDNALYCGANEQDTCFFFTIEPEGPNAWLIFPPDSSSISCDDIFAIWGLFDRNGVNAATIRVAVDNDTILYGDPRLSYVSDSLKLDLTGISEGEHKLSLVSAEDNLGNPMSGGELVSTFVYDKSPPYFTNLRPSNNETLRTRSPEFSAEIGDSLSGLARHPLLMTINFAGTTRYYALSDYPALTLEGNTLRFSSSLAGLSFRGGDTIKICLIAYDSIDYCSPNMGDTCVTFSIEYSPPIVELISPQIGVFTSCADQKIKLRIIDSNGIIASSIKMVVNGVLYMYGDAELSMTADTLIFTPSVPFADGTRVYFSLISAMDSLMNNIPAPYSGYFNIDLSPPFVRYFYPPDSSLTPDTLQNITIALDDNLSGVDSTSILVSVDGVLYDITNPLIEYRDGVFTYSPRIGANAFNLVDTVRVVLVRVLDKAGLCSANGAYTLLSFTFFVDARRPLIFPPSGVISACERQNTWIYLWSPLGFNPGSILLSVNGTIYTTDSTEILFVNDTLYYNPVSNWSNCDTANIILVHASDGINNIDSMSWNFTTDYLAPNIEIITPIPEETVSTLNPTISFVLDDNCSGIDWSSFNLIVMENILTIGDERISIRGDTLSIRLRDAGISVCGGDTVTLRIKANDRTSPLYCGSNSIDTSWSFYIEPGGPSVRLISPNLSNAYLSCAEPEIRFIASDRNGIRSVIVVVNGVQVSPENGVIRFSGDTVIYRPRSPFEDGDSLSFVVFAEDSLLNVSDTLYAQFRIDLTAPELTIINPAHSGTTRDSVRTIRAIVKDALSGIDTSSIIVQLNGAGATWGLSGDTLIIMVSPPTNAFDTVFYEISVSDNAGGCPQNSSRISGFFVRDLQAPSFSLIYPLDGEYVSCAFLPITYSIYDPSGINPLSLALDIEGIELTLESIYLRFREDTLTFYPPFSWGDRDTVRFRLINCEDVVGNTTGETLYHYFIPDLDPPVLSDITPSPDDTIYNLPLIISANIVDSLSGINPELLSIRINGEVELSIHSPGVYFEDGRLVVNLNNSGLYFHGGDSIHICITAGDSPDRCSPNISDTCYKLYIYRESITASILEPPEGSWSACPQQTIRLLIHHRIPIDPSSIMFAFMGETLGISDPRLSLSGDTLIFMPASSFQNGEIYRYSLAGISDILGNNLEFPLTSSFGIDLEPPLALLLNPISGCRTNQVNPLISWRLQDTLSGAVFDSLSVNGEWFGTFDGVRVEGNMVEFSYNISMLVGSIEVCLFAHDNALLCGPNITLECDTFFVDTFPPDIHLLEPEPNSVVSCAEPFAKFTVRDSDGIDTAGLILSVNSIRSSDFVYSVFGETLLVYIPGSFATGETIRCTLFVADTLGNQSYREFSEIIDLAPPEIIEYSPLGGVFDTLSLVKFIARDTPAGVDSSSLSVSINGIEIRAGEPGILWNGEQFIYDPSITQGEAFTELESVNVSVRLTDRSLLCPKNETFFSWTFWVLDDDTIPPILLSHTPARIYPGWQTEIRLKVLDKSGVYEDTVENYPHIEWRVPGEDSSRILPARTTDVIGDTTFLVTSEPITIYENVSAVEFRLFAYDNDFDHNRASDRMLGVSPWRQIPVSPYTLTPGSMNIDLGEVCVGNSVVLTLLLRNPGPLTIQIDSTAETGTSEITAEIRPLLPVLLAPLDSLTIRVKFSPTTTNGFTKQLLLFSPPLVNPVASINFNGSARLCLPENFSVAPNPFSPNNDGINDKVIFEFPWQGRTEVIIYNMSGKEITRLYGNLGRVEWDGKSKSGEVQRAGIYPYAIILNGEVKAKGSVVIVR